MKPTLLILAAGMGSRYGGLKQIDGIGPNQEPIIEYSIYDAINSGFGKIVFVIRREFDEAFRSRFDKFSDKIDIQYAYQEVNIKVKGINRNEKVRKEKESEVKRRVGMERKVKKEKARRKIKNGRDDKIVKLMKKCRK